MQDRIEFTRDMKRDYTILIPNMLPVHLKLVRDVFQLHGYRMVLLQNEGPSVVETGLKYVHNDTCYPALSASASLSTRCRAANTTCTRPP